MQICWFVCLFCVCLFILVQEKRHCVQPCVSDINITYSLFEWSIPLALCNVKLLFAPLKALWVLAPALLVLNFYLVFDCFWGPIPNMCVQLTSLMMTSNFIPAHFSMLIHLHSNCPTRTFLFSSELPHSWRSIKALALPFPCLLWKTLGFGWLCVALWTCYASLFRTCEYNESFKLTCLSQCNFHGQVGVILKNLPRSLTPPFPTYLW